MSANIFLGEMQALVDHAEQDGTLVLLNPRGLQLLIDLARTGSELAGLKIELSMDLSEGILGLYERDLSGVLAGKFKVRVGNITNSYRGAQVAHQLWKLRRAIRAIERAQAEADAIQSAPAQ